MTDHANTPAGEPVRDGGEQASPNPWRPTYAQTHLPVWHPAREMADREQRQYERGIAEGERAATQRIIEWLRAEHRWQEDRATRAANNGDTEAVRAANSACRALERVIDRIRRGEHHE